MDGVVTLVDAKNVLPRLRDGEMEMSLEKEQGGNEAADTVDEAFQQIMFSDRIVVNKVCSPPRSDCGDFFLFRTILLQEGTLSSSYRELGCRRRTVQTTKSWDATENGRRHGMIFY